jgi:polysaccharide biosynthesis/export protein
MRILSQFRLHLLLFVLMALGCGASLLLAQDRRAVEDRFKARSQQTSEPAPPPNVIVSTKEDYRIGAGDSIEIRVEDAPELLTRTRVNSKGSILMPYLQHIEVGGKTTEEVTALVAGKLRGKYLKNPQVSVAITQVNSHSFLIQGAVRRPGPFQIEGRPTLFGLIGYAGGLMDNHGSRAFIIRELKETGKAVITANVGGAEVSEIPKYEMLTSNISSLYKGRFDENIILEPGDVVNIPPTDVFFVAGAVNAPGEFPLKDGTTLRQAVALAQNWTNKAEPKKAVIFREGINGERKEVAVDLHAVMNNKNPDVPILANDIIIIPDSKLKSALIPVLNAFGTGASFAVGGRVGR